MKHILFTLVFFFLMTSCQKDKEYIYEVNPNDILTPTANKNKLKSTAQYAAVIYANLFQRAISTSDQLEIERLLFAIGDKRLAWELIISSYMNDPTVIIPDDATMRGDIPSFLNTVYNRFYARVPSELELEYFTNYLENNPNISAELVYVAFAISDEYFFY